MNNSEWSELFMVSLARTVSIIEGNEDRKRKGHSVCETELLSASSELSDLIRNRDQSEWAGSEMLGKIIGRCVFDLYVRR